MTVLDMRTIRNRCRECGECWEWISGATVEHNKRHPQVKHAGKVLLVRRVAYEIERGPIKPALFIVPHCGNPYCINPAHQKAVTESQKGSAAAARGAFSNPARGRKIAEARRKTHAKLTMDQAVEIRHSNESGTVLAARFGINRSRVNQIRAGMGWKDYSNPFAGLM
ncbi:MAG: hypothetical protein WC023_06495 [Rhodocyclaceae bacterium]